MTGRTSASDGVAWFYVPMVMAAAADIVSKVAAEQLLSGTKDLLSFVTLRVHYNHGVIFGLLQAQTPLEGWGLVAFAAIALVLLTWVGVREDRHPSW